MKRTRQLSIAGLFVLLAVFLTGCKLATPTEPAPEPPPGVTRESCCWIYSTIHVRRASDGSPIQGVRVALQSRIYGNTTPDVITDENGIAYYDAAEVWGYSVCTGGGDDIIDFEVGVIGFEPLAFTHTFTYSEPYLEQYVYLSPRYY